MYENKYEEREIDLSDLMWGVLEQIRIILIIGVIFAFLVPLGIGVKYVTRSSGQTDIVVTDAQYENQYQTMIFALSLYMQYRNLESEYVKNGDLMSDNSKELLDMAKKYNDVREAYSKAIGSLTEDNQKLFIEFVKSLNKEDIEQGKIDDAKMLLDEKMDARVMVASHTTVDVFTAKNIIVGFFAGVFIYSSVIVLGSIFTEKVKNAGDVEKSFNVRHYGNIYKYPYRGMLEQFVHHKVIYELRKKSDKASKIAGDLATKLGYIGDNKVTIITLGTGHVIDEQVSVLNEQGIKVNTLKIEGNVADLKDSDFLSISPVFIQVNSGKTTYKVLSDLKNKLEEYDVKVIGTEFVEV
ncbi:hypothetical protein [Pseudobutyrivibrio xylanivorans]|uniref:Capsular polysaccharide biosynthesis protein n=1 Tax=Pseudobutyrivibrio xylanivorans TaxID=185007 RepID=A0A1G5S5P0_PSEXY|nr:hypothetical protein [Pseudobutyrivibrio xylanivorans]SCZ81190.1 Capsular polysaccharide biosynthesis protein [Pseudobutyrivibrio xylanivorans]